MNNSQSDQIYLKAPSQKGTVSLEEAIAQRRSLRNFSSESISQSQLSQILWSSQGVTDAQGRYRAVPSAGAIYPLEIFIACGENSVEGIDDGVYHYNPTSHSLSLHHEGEIRLELARAALNQEYIYQAPVDIVICALYERTIWGYGSRGERYVHIEVGHVGQNIYLQATALGLATVAIGAFYDEQVRQALRLDSQYKPLYIMPVGKPGV